LISELFLLADDVADYYWLITELFLLADDVADYYWLITWLLQLELMTWRITIG